MQFRKEKTVETHLGTIHISYIHIDNWSICINLKHFSNPLRPSTLDVLSLKTTKKIKLWIYWFISQVPQCIRPMTHNTPFCNKNVHACYKMVHCRIWDWCIAGFMQQVYSFIWYLFLVSESKMLSIKIMDREDLYHWKINWVLIRSETKCTFQPFGVKTCLYFCHPSSVTL